MNKNKKIIIGIFLLIAIVIGSVLIIIYNQRLARDGKVNLNANIGETNFENVFKKDVKEVQRKVKIDGILYYDTGEKSTELRCGMMDGKITSNVEPSEIPTENNQSNFEGEYNYQFWGDNTIQIFIDDEWCIFEAKNSQIENENVFYGKVVESRANNIVVEPNEGEEIRRTSDKISIGLRR